MDTPWLKDVINPWNFISRPRITAAIAIFANPSPEKGDTTTKAGGALSIQRPRKVVEMKHSLVDFESDVDAM